VVVKEEERRVEKAGAGRSLDAVPLQRAQVVGVSELGPQLLEELPVPPRALFAEVVDEMFLQIRRDRIVVEQRVVDVEQEDGVIRHPRRILEIGELVNSREIEELVNRCR